jgi:hypothetical protein
MTPAGSKLRDSRRELAAAQADLVRCLVSGSPAPRGFDAARLDAAATALLDKRSRYAARAIPRTALHYGDAFTTCFTGWAQTHPLRTSTDAAVDSIRFLRSRPRRERWSLPAPVVAEWVALEVGARRRHLSIRRSSDGLVVGLRPVRDHTTVRVLMRGRGPMVPHTNETVAVLTFGRPRLIAGPVHVSLKTPCAIDSTGVTLYRWPWRSIHVPLERVDRFDVVVVQESPFPQDHRDYDAIERLALRTRDGKPLLVVPTIVNPRRAPPPGPRAQQLNNHIVRVRRSREH